MNSALFGTAMPAPDATTRFSDRVHNYVLYRPGYPPEVLDLLRSECHLTSYSIIADIASGTGILTRMFLENGNQVFGVEPNPKMRKAGERFLADYEKFTSVAATAEDTTLPSQSIDFVTAAQAAHWFDRGKARAEFARILKPGGWCVLIWNERRTDSTPFLHAYEEMIQTYGTDYREVRHERTTETIDSFFAPTPFHSRVFEMSQQFDYAGLEGRLLSSSYAPQKGHRNYEPMLATLRAIFDKFNNKGEVSLEYNTQVYYGSLT